MSDEIRLEKFRVISRTIYIFLNGKTRENQIIQVEAKILIVMMSFSIRIFCGVFEEMRKLKLFLLHELFSRQSLLREAIKKKAKKCNNSLFGLTKVYLRDCFKMYCSSRKLTLLTQEIS